MTPWSLLVPRKALRWGRLTSSLASVDVAPCAHCGPQKGLVAISPHVDSPTASQMAQAHQASVHPLEMGGPVPTSAPVVLTPEDFPLIHPDREDNPS